MEELVAVVLVHQDFPIPGLPVVLAVQVLQYQSLE
jgi:hypothetical protein